MTKIEIAKKRAEMLKGIQVTLQVNEGRNRFTNYDGEVKDLYPYVFTFEATLYGEKRILSFSYVDLMTKRIKIFPLEEKKVNLLS